MKCLRDYLFDVGDFVRVKDGSMLLPGESGKVVGYSFSGLVQVRVDGQRRRKPYYFIPTELIKESPK